MNQKKIFEEKVQSVVSLFSNNQIEKALEINQSLIIEYPNEPLLFNISGACQFSLGAQESAIVSFQKAIAVKPDYAEAHFNLGNCFRAIGSLPKALLSFQKSLAIRPNYPQAHNNLGVTYQDLGQLNDAIDSFEWAIAYKFDYAEAYNNLGNVQRLLNQFDNGIVNLKKAISINPSYAEAYKNLGNAKEEVGNLDEAQENYEKALSISPNYALAYYDLSYLKQYSPNDPQIKQMKLLLSNNTTSLSDKVHINFALATIHENLGDHEQLFNYLHEGNRLRKKEINYSFESSKKLISIIREFFLPCPKIELSSNLLSKSRPIFIVGMPRSGTTLVEQIISSHHSVYGAGELNSLANAIEPILNSSVNQNQHDLTNNDFHSIRKKYLDSLSNLNISKDIFTDKMPLNFQYIGFILTALPEAKIINLKRDAMAVCWSNYKRYFNSSGNGWAYDLIDCANFYKLYNLLMEFWHQLFPGKIYDISYEDLTINQEEETRKLLEYCELDWDENCLNFHTNKRAVNTASAAQVRQKMYQGSSEAWKQYESHLMPLIKGLDLL